MKCEHKSCGNKEKVWLPHISREAEYGLRLHPYRTTGFAQEQIFVLTLKKYSNIPKSIIKPLL
jgi:hypothetical protein